MEQVQIIPFYKANYLYAAACSGMFCYVLLCFPEYAWIARIVCKKYCLHRNVCRRRNLSQAVAGHYTCITNHSKPVEDWRPLIRREPILFFLHTSCSNETTEIIRIKQITNCYTFGSRSMNEFIVLQINTNM